MVRSASQSIKSGRATPNENPMTQTKNQSRSQSRRASISASLHKAYGEVKKKGLCKYNFYKNLNLTFKYFLIDNAIPTRYVVVFVAALGKRKLKTTFCLIICANKLIFMLSLQPTLYRTQWEQTCLWLLWLWSTTQLPAVTTVTRVLLILETVHLLLQK